MTKIAALSVQIPTSHAASLSAAPVAKGRDKVAEVPAAAPVAPVTPAAPAPPAISARNTAAPSAPTLGSALLGALIDLQSKVEAPAPKTEQLLQSVVQTITDHSTSPAPAQTRTPTSLDHGAGRSSDDRSADRDDHGARSGHDGHVDHGQGDDHSDRGWRHKPPTPQPPPVPEPKPVVIPSFDPGLPARAIAEANKILADGRVSDAAREAFVTASVQRRAQAFVAQGQAALLTFQDMHAEYSAWQQDQTRGFLKALYA